MTVHEGTPIKCLFNPHLSLTGFQFFYMLSDIDTPDGKIYLQFVDYCIFLTKE